MIFMFCAQCQRQKLHKEKYRNLNSSFLILASVTPPFDMFFGLYSQGTTFSLESPLIIQTVGMKCLTPGFFKAVSQAPGSRKCQINAGDPNRIYPIIGPLNMDLTPGSCPDHGASEAQSLGKSQLGGSCR